MIIFETVMLIILNLFILGRLILSLHTELSDDQPNVNPVKPQPVGVPAVPSNFEQTGGKDMEFHAMPV